MQYRSALTASDKIIRYKEVTGLVLSEGVCYQTVRPETKGVNYERLHNMYAGFPELKALNSGNRYITFFLLYFSMYELPSFRVFLFMSNLDCYYAPILIF